MEQWPVLRNILLFVGGFLGVGLLTVNWVVSDETPDSSLMILFGAMMGLPAFLNKDEK